MECVFSVERYLIDIDVVDARAQSRVIGGMLVFFGQMWSGVASCICIHVKSELARDAFSCREFSTRAKRLGLLGSHERSHTTDFRFNVLLVIGL